MGKSHPDCISSSNPYHECVDYCYTKIADARKLESEKDIEKKLEERTVHPVASMRGILTTSAVHIALARSRRRRKRSRKMNRVCNKKMVLHPPAVPLVRMKSF